jgi:hypothetical protein
MTNNALHLRGVVLMRLTDGAEHHLPENNGFRGSV